MKPNNKFGIYNKSYDLIIATLKLYPEIEKAIIFGSRAMGNYKKGSDIDIAISGNDVSFETTIRLKGQLNDSSPIPYFVDVVDYHSITSEDLKKHIDKFGIIFYIKH